MAVNLTTPVPFPLGLLLSAPDTSILKTKLEGIIFVGGSVPPPPSTFSSPEQEKTKSISKKSLYISVINIIRKSLREI